MSITRKPRTVRESLTPSMRGTVLRLAPTRARYLAAHGHDLDAVMGSAEPIRASRAASPGALTAVLQAPREISRRNPGLRRVLRAWRTWRIPGLFVDCRRRDSNPDTRIMIVRDFGL